MLYKANPSDNDPRVIAGAEHPEDTARTDDAIRALLREENAAGSPAPNNGRKGAGFRASIGRLLARPSCSPVGEAGGRATSETGRRSSVSGFRPGWKLSGGILLTAVVIWHPWLIAALLLLTVAISAILWFSLGPDRGGMIVARWYDGLARRDPDRAEALRLRAARWSARAERLAAKLPERWTRGLYFPDFELEEVIDDTCPFERLVPQNRL